MNHIYKVPIIPQNLGKQETIIQIAEVLDHLSNITDEIFKHVTNRIEGSNTKLSNISERIEKVNKKIVKLTGLNKATQVFSSCKYPATDLNEPYKSIFNNVKPVEINRHKIKHKRVILHEEPLDKLFVYHVKVKTERNEPINGLGEVPIDINSVNDLLLYNSGKNLYKKFELSNALEINQQVKQQETESSSTIGAAPYSITERATLPRPPTNYFYTPNLGEVPSLDVPLDLPDLPGIADDLRYTTELDPGIAPSVVTSNIPELPLIPLKDKKIELLPPPPPPPPPALEIEEPIRLPEQPSQPLPPPPPPPPPAPLKAEEKSIPVVTDVRANLMEAIRQAGGRKTLKTTKVEEKSKTTSGGGDLMADLHAKLSMRRKGISGTKKSDCLDAGSSALEKISAMIPPPNTSLNDSESNIEDEDWDD